MSAVFHLRKSFPVAGSAWGRQQLPLTQNGICCTMRAVAGWQLPLPDGLVLWRDFFQHLKDNVSWSRQLTFSCFWDRLLQLICPNLYVDILIFDLTLFFDFSWRWQELQGQLTKKQGDQLCIYLYVSMIYNYSSHFWEKAKTHVRMSINNQCLSERKTLTSCLPLRDDDPFNSHPRLSWYQAFTRFCYITYWKEIRI